MPASDALCAEAKDYDDVLGPSTAMQRGLRLKTVCLLGEVGFVIF
jgi:hypothetical protein